MGEIIAQLANWGEEENPQELVLPEHRRYLTIERVVIAVHL